MIEDTCFVLKDIVEFLKEGPEEPLLLCGEARVDDLSRKFGRRRSGVLDRLFV